MCYPRPISGPRKIQLSDIDLNLLVALHALLDTGSVTQAAAQIGITQSAMSHTLRRLRSLLGDKLLVRGRAGMHLTPRAEALREPLFHNLLALQETIRASSSFVAAESEREIALSATDFLQLLFLPQLARILGQEAPRMRLRVITAPVDRYADMLGSGELDLMVGSVLVDSHPRIRRELVTMQRMLCAVRRDHPRIAGALSLDQYTELPHVLISPSGKGPGLVDDLLAGMDRSRRIAVRLSSFLIAPWVVASSDCILTAPERVITMLHDTLHLQVLEPPLELAAIPIALLWHERSLHDPAIQWLRSVIARAFSEDIASFQGKRGHASAR